MAGDQHAGMHSWYLFVNSAADACPTLAGHQEYRYDESHVQGASPGETLVPVGAICCKYAHLWRSG
jgi:hypothetical protein